MYDTASPPVDRERRESPLGVHAHLRIETLGSELVVLDPRRQVVHRLTGTSVEAVQLLRSGTTADQLPDHLLPALESLRAAELLDEPALPGRRRLLKFGVGAAIGITTLGLPSAAAAQSIGGLADQQPLVAFGPVVTHTLSVSLAGSGSGTVVSDPVGISTPAFDSATFEVETVDLTATPSDETSTFEGWSVDATGSDPTTTVVMDGDKSVTATFVTVTLSAASAGTGQVAISWDES